MERSTQPFDSLDWFAPVSIEMNDVSGADQKRLSEREQQLTAGFPVARHEPLCYPGARPNHSFTVIDGQIAPSYAVETADGPQFGVKLHDGVYDLNDLLAAHGVASMEERLPIIGFGSNGSPSQLAQKFAPESNRQGHIVNPGDHIIVPTLWGRAKDIAAAYSSKLGINGYVFAEVIDAPGAETTVAVNFLSPDQLHQMTSIEGAYELCQLGEVTIDGFERPITAYGYAGKHEVMLDASGSPILLEAIHTTGYDAPSMTEEEIMTMLAEDYGGRMDALYPNAPVYVNSAANLSALMTYRIEFLRRTGNSKTIYKHATDPSEHQQLLVGEALRSILRLDGRVSNQKILDRLPPEHRNVTPEPFGALYAQAQREEVSV